MTTTKRIPCPLCGTPLPERRFLAITGRWQQLQDVERQFHHKLKAEVNKARRAERARVSQDLIVRDRKISMLTGQLKKAKEQSERGLTPQLEGLLYEKELAAQLAHKFRRDRIVPAGKRGDVLHYVTLNGKSVGTIVYECKKVATLQRSHVEQARRAMVQREADYAVVVTSAKAARNSFGFWVEKDVLLVHPAGALMLAAWLRDTLLELAKARLPRSDRERAARAILDFIASPPFKNAIQDTARRAEELGRELKDEVRAHRTMWLRRLEHYAAIWLDARGLALAVARALGGHSERKLLPVFSTQSLKYPVEKAALSLQQAS